MLPSAASGVNLRAEFQRFVFLTFGWSNSSKANKLLLGEGVQEEIPVLCPGEGLPNRVTLRHRSDEIGCSSEDILWLGCNLAQEWWVFSLSTGCAGIIPSLVHVAGSTFTEDAPDSYLQMPFKILGYFLLEVS